MKQNKVLLLLIVCLITFFIGFVISINSINVQKNNTIDFNTLLTKKSVEYEVYLKKNSVIEEKTLKMNKSYIAKLVDKIKFDYNFAYTGDSELEYSLNAYLNVDYQNANIVTTPNIVKKQYELIETTKVKNNKKVISKTIDLDYPYYNEELQEIEKVISVPMKAYIDLIFQVKECETGKTYTTTYNIPLAQEVFSISSKNNTTIQQNQKDKVVIDEIPCIIGVALLLGSTIIFVKNIKKMNFSKEEVTYYTMKLNRILQSYGDIVVELVEPVVLKDVQIINVKNFEQLIDIEMEIRNPILFYETISRQEGEFLIVQDKIAYRYILKDIKSHYKYKRRI